MTHADRTLKSKLKKAAVIGAVDRKVFLGKYGTLDNFKCLCEYLRRIPHAKPDDFTITKLKENLDYVTLDGQPPVVQLPIVKTNVKNIAKSLLATGISYFAARKLIKMFEGLIISDSKANDVLERPIVVSKTGAILKRSNLLRGYPPRGKAKEYVRNFEIQHKTAAALMAGFNSWDAARSVTLIKKNGKHFIFRQK